MGICVGLSFYSTSGAILRGMEMALNWKKKRYAKNQKVAELPRFWTKAEEEDPTNPGFKCSVLQPYAKTNVPETM